MKLQQQKRILITGIPGMGKTTLGNLFESKKGFVHLDMETHPKEHLLLESNREEFMNLIICKDKDFIITFGFYPPNCTGEVKYLRDQGFILIWLDGNRDAAYRSYKTRTEKQDHLNLQLHLEAFNMQIERIERTGVVKEIEPIIVNTFDSEGNFRDIVDVAQEIISFQGE